MNCLSASARSARASGDSTRRSPTSLHFPAQQAQQAERFRKFTYAEIAAQDKANLDILWLKEDSLEDSDKLPPPAELAAEIVEGLEAALEEFRAVEEALATDLTE